MVRRARKKGNPVVKSPMDTIPAAPPEAPQEPAAAPEAAPKDQAEAHAEPAAEQAEPAAEPHIEALFPEAPRTYLDLMNMATPEVLARCADRLRSSDDPLDETLYLLEDSNWRRTLVGVCWLLFQGHLHDRRVQPLLWRAVDGSWIAPQAAVVAYLVDPRFPQEAERRLRAVQRDPAQSLHKSRGALAALYPRLPQRDPALAAWLGSPAARFTHEAEWARGFATGWLQRLSSFASLRLQQTWLRRP